MIDETQQKQQNENPKNQAKKIQNYAFSYEWKLGAGSFSQVYKGVDTRNNSAVAVKVIKKQSLTSKIAITLLEQEINILKQLNHENVIHCYDVLNSSNNCYIITEFCKYGDVSKLLQMKRKFAQGEIAWLIYQIYKGLKYLAQNHIIHRDLKTANIFIDQTGVCKIADFGFAIKSKQIFTDICLGSPIYMAPQSIFYKKYGPKTDIWAFGVIIYQLICGKAPLADVKSKQQLQQQIMIPVTIKQQISAQLKNFIDRCLTIKWQNRISIQEMQNHQFIRKLAYQNQTSKLSGSTSMMDSTQSKYTSKSSKLIYKALQNPLSYEEAVSLLQYCRLLSKVCQCLKSSPILQQWLLRMMHDLNKAKLKQNQPIDYNQYKQTVANYYNRYYKQFKDKGIKVRIDDVLKQCEQLLNKQKKYKQQIMAIGSQTMLLKQALFHPLRLVYFAKTSNAAKYMS